MSSISKTVYPCKQDVAAATVACEHMQITSLKHEKQPKHYTSQPIHHYNKQTVAVTFHQQNTGSPCLMPICCTPFCFNAPRQLTQPLILCHLFSIYHPLAGCALE
jgi:hypothetical protein